MPPASVSSLEISRDDRGRHGLFAWSSEARDPRSIRLRLSGELDLDGLDELRVALPGAEDPIDRLVVDLVDLDFIDCSAVGLLFRAADRISHGGGRLRLVGAHGQAARVLDLVGLPSTMRVLDDGR